MKKKLSKLTLNAGAFNSGIFFKTMATIDDLLEKWERYDVLSTVRQSIINTKEDLLEVQRLQMLEGKNSDGEEIGEYKSEKYALKKYEINPVPGLGVPDLRLTGEWQGELDVEVGSDTVTIKAPENEKTPRLIELFGLQILGLNQESSAVYSVQYLQPEFIKLATDALR